MQILVAFQEDKHGYDIDTEYQWKLHFQSSPCNTDKVRSIAIRCVVNYSQTRMKLITTHMPLFGGRTVKQKMVFHPTFNLLLFAVGCDGLQVNQLVYSLSSAEFALSALLCF